MRALLVLSITGLLVAPASAERNNTELPGGEVAVAKAGEAHIQTLIKQLGDGRWLVRQEATRKLTQIGLPALPAIRKAILSRNLEVSVRARLICKRILGLTTDEPEEYRKKLHEAFFKTGNYAQMVKLGELATTAAGANMLDWLWYGHSCQLAGKWKKAVKAYQKVVSLLDADLAAGIKKKTPQPKGPEGVVLVRPGGRAPKGPMEYTPLERKKLINQRTVLTMWIARIQAVELKNPKAAAASLAKAVAYLESTKTEVDYVWLRILKASAIALHDSGDVHGAFGAWTKLREARAKSKYRTGGTYVDVERIAAGLATLKPGEKLPAIPCIFVLTPDQPGAKFILNDPQTRKRSYHPSANRNSPHWKYAFAPPPGKEFAAIEFACDIEQLKSRYGGHFICFVTPRRGRMPKILGHIGWPNKKPVGREIRRKTINIPPGVKAVHIETGSWKGYFNIHSVQVKATFRPVTKNPKPLHAGAHIQINLLPKGGKLTCDDRILRNRCAYSDFRPGKYRLRYEVPGRDDKFEADFVVAPGGKYMIFVNLDSPFRWTQTGQWKMNRGAISPHTSIATLPDGSRLAVWCGPDNKIMLSRSKDLITWTSPERPPFNSIFDNISPATMTASDGTVWLAYFSKRLSLQDTSTAGYRLFVTSTRDGKNWTTIKTVSIGIVDGWPIGAVHMLQGPDGKSWIFWKNYAASAKSIGDIRRLNPIQVAQGKKNRPHLFNPHVTIDGKGLFHMIFDDFSRGIYHTTSRDGLNWKLPSVIVEDAGKFATCHGQLLSAKGKTVLLYQDLRGAYALPFRFDGKPRRTGEGLKIAGSLRGSRAIVTPDGEVLLLTGGYTSSWLLRAKLKDLLDIQIGDTGGNAP